MIFTKNQYTTLLHNINNKTTNINNNQNYIKTQIIQYRHTYFFITLLPYHLTNQQSQFTINLTPQNTKKTKLLNTIQKHPNINIFNVITQKFTHFLTDLPNQTTPINILTDIFHDITY